jgi:hypothetical protein
LMQKTLSLQSFVYRLLSEDIMSTDKI